VDRRPFEDLIGMPLRLADDTDGMAPKVAELRSDGLWILGPEFFEAT
jgi:hypothetical protein